MRAWVFLILAGCSRERVQIVPPDSVAYWAAVSSSDSGSPNSPLRSVEDPLEIEDVGGDIAVLGWSAESVERLIRPDLESVWTNQPLVVASGCEQALPPPEWSLRKQSETEVPENELPRLTASWIQSACPDESEVPDGIDVLSAHVPCSYIRCPVRRTQECQVEIAFEDCSLGANLEGTLDWTGQGCFQDPEGSCVTLPTAEGRVASVSCNIAGKVCRTDVQRHRTLPEPSIERVSLVPEITLPRPGVTDEQGIVARGDFEDAYIADFELLDDDHIVATGGDCSIPGSPRYFIIDRQTLEVTTATSAYCPGPIWPESGTFLTAHLEGEEVILERMDANFHRIALVSVSVPHVRRIEDILKVGEKIFVFTTRRDGDFQSSTWLTADPTTLAWVGEPIGMDTIQAISPIKTPAGFAAIEDDRDFLFEANDSGEILGQTPPLCSAVGVQDKKSLFVASAGASFLVGIGSTNPQIATGSIDAGTNCRNFDEGDADPTAGAQLGSQSWISLRLHGPGLGWSVLAPFDTLDLRFEPVALPVAPGAVRRMLSDSKGALWLSLPWTGEILKVTGLEGR